jgi:hypothetical protein
MCVCTKFTVHLSLLIWCWTNFCLQYSGSLSWNGLVQVSNSLYTILLADRLQVALEMLQVGICS